MSKALRTSPSLLQIKHSAIVLYKALDVPDFAFEDPYTLVLSTSTIFWEGNMSDLTVSFSKGRHTWKVLYSSIQMATKSKGSTLSIMLVKILLIKPADLIKIPNNNTTK